MNYLYSACVVLFVLRMSVRTVRVKYKQCIEPSVVFRIFFPTR